METAHTDSLGLTGCAEHFLATVHAERERVRKFVAAYQVRLEKAEAVIESQLQRLEEQAGESAAGPVAVASPVSEYQRRYEMALNDLQALKAKYVDLQKQLGVSPATSSPGKLDWEAEKRRVLAALEADCDTNDLTQRAERVRIEDVLRTTEQALAEKDAEIEDLKQRLQEASTSTSRHSQQNAIEYLDHDDLIREERQRLADLQNEWREKIRQTEVELSLERAKLARQRAELEERSRGSDDSLSNSKNDKARDAAKENSARQLPRGRWLARLGITDPDS